jgi:LEA14-like dessication related protein
LPDFEIGLHVINPNRVPLPLRGVAYTISLNDYELIKGVGNDLPVIDAYGEDTLTLTASPNLFAGIRFITELMGASQESVRYEIEAKLDVGTFLPPIRVSDSGEISLRPATSN